jgi:Divergent InlB B-repeat domain
MVFQIPAIQPTATSFSLTNTIVSNNGALACVVFGLTPTVVGSGNLIQQNAGCPGAITDSDPMLGPLQPNGGLTPTMAITDSSPAFDAGVLLPTEHTDQRGARRPQGQGFDIGAFEACVFDPKQDCFGFHAFVFTRHLDTSAFPVVSGTVTPSSGDYPLNSVQPLKATSNAGFSFLNWTGTVGDPNKASTFIAMDQDHVVTANFAGCAINVSGRATAGTAIRPPRVDLTWAPNGADHANVFRSAIGGGPYALVGTTTTTAFMDTTAGLVNNTTAYYLVQFFAATGVKMCDSNEVSVTIPRGR